MFLLIYKLLWTCWKWQAINMEMNRNDSKATILKACSQLVQQLLDCLFILCINTLGFGAQVGYLTTGYEYKSFV